MISRSMFSIRISLFFLLNSCLAVWTVDREVAETGGMSMWIDEKQVKEFSGFSTVIHVIVDDVVLHFVDPHFEKYLPVIPPEVSCVNFTWKSTDRRTYRYHFDQLISFNTSILSDPYISVPIEGKVPKRPHSFSVHLPCLGNSTGIASFAFGLRITKEDGRPLDGTPLRLRLQKQCRFRGQHPECDRNCANGGWCNSDRVCECLKGYIGEYCESALCFPVCMNGGACIAPGQCSCASGFQGTHCEGGICSEKCQNGGKCIQKDTCACRKGYYGARCEYSKCLIPCLNGGRCVGVNRCRCRKSFAGQQCELQSDDESIDTGTTPRTRNKKKRKYV